MSEEVQKKKKSLLQRLATGFSLVGILAVVLAAGSWPTAILVVGCLTVALYEEFHAFTLGGHKPVWWPSFAALFAAVPLMLLASSAAFAPVLMMACLLILVCVMRRKQPDLIDIMVSALPLFSIVLPGMCILGILNTAPRALQLYLLVLVFAIPVLGDTCAYFVGSAVGGPKLCPPISPNKTIAGAIGGLAGSVLAAWIVGLLFALFCPGIAFPPFWANMLVGLIGGVAAQVGDLLASMVKRHCRLKDFGHIFPGHGGMMDRMDSIVFTAIVIYCFRAVIGG